MAGTGGGGGGGGGGSSSSSSNSLLQLPVKLNGKPLHESARTPGSYLSIDRVWHDGDTISLSLPTDVYTLSKYTGADQVAGYANKRYALSVGPIVLACIALPGQVFSKQFTAVLPIDPTAAIKTWLSLDSPEQSAAAGFRRSYSIAGVVGFKFAPMWEIPPLSTFTTYPIFSPH
jgi:DUF1680 family protein